jgi:hypothetical protein
MSELEMITKIQEQAEYIHRLKRDLVDAVQNIQAHSMIVDASEKDIEIAYLKELATRLSAALKQRIGEPELDPMWKLVREAEEIVI